MERLHIDVTDELKERVEKAANAGLVTPEHMAGCILAGHFADRKKSSWLSPQVLQALATALGNAATALAKQTTQE